MRARCNSTLFEPGFNYKWVEAHNAGTLYDATSKQCCYCSARLFRGEAAIPMGVMHLWVWSLSLRMGATAHGPNSISDKF